MTMISTDTPSSVQQLASPDGTAQEDPIRMCRRGTNYCALMPDVHTNCALTGKSMLNNQATVTRESKDL